MKEGINFLALFGGVPAFHEKLHVGQMNTPNWDSYETAFRGIFNRQSFANHGPLVKTLEEKLARYLNVQHVVCMTNGTIALMVAAKALELKGTVILPAFTFVATVHAMTWAGLEPLFCDVDETSHTITGEIVEPLIHKDVSAILGVHLWGRHCPVEEIEQLAQQYKLAHFYDAAHAVGCTYKGQMIGNFGDLEVISFHATKIINGAEGGCVTTNDSYLADKLRTIRSFHQQETFCQAPLRINAKMSEAQAAMAMLSLQDIGKNIAANQDRYMQYAQRIAGMDGVSIINYDEKEQNNYQYVVIEVDTEKCLLNRNELVRLFEAENIMARRYFAPGVHKTIPYATCCGEGSSALPVTNRLCEGLFQLPSGHDITREKISKICDLLAFLIENAQAIKHRLRKN